MIINFLACDIHMLTNLFRLRLVPMLYSGGVSYLRLFGGM